MRLMNLAVNHFENATVNSLPTGAPRKHYVAKRWWGLSLNMKAVNVWLNISQISTTTGVEVWWEYSWDGRMWLRPPAAVISKQTAIGSYAVEMGTSAYIAPFGRLVVEVFHDDAPTVEKSAVIDLRAHYKTDK